MILLILLAVISCVSIMVWGVIEVVRTLKDKEPSERKARDIVQWVYGIGALLIVLYAIIECVKVWIS